MGPKRPSTLRRAGGPFGGRLDDENPGVDQRQEGESGGRIVESVDEHQVRSPLELDEELADRPHRGEGRGEGAPRIAVDRDPIRSLGAHPVHHLRMQRGPGGGAEKLDEAGGGLDIEQEGESRERPVEIEHRYVPPPFRRE